MSEIERFKNVGANTVYYGFSLYARLGDSSTSAEDFQINN